MLQRLSSAYAIIACFLECRLPLVMWLVYDHASTYISVYMHYVTAFEFHQHAPDSSP